MGAGVLITRAEPAELRAEAPWAAASHFLEIEQAVGESEDLRLDETPPGEVAPAPVQRVPHLPGAFLILH
eukprot:4760197-Alexandrium_andersonii.AAC.1